MYNLNLSVKYTYHIIYIYTCTMSYGAVSPYLHTCVCCYVQRTQRTRGNQGLGPPGMKNLEPFRGQVLGSWIQFRLQDSGLWGFGFGVQSLGFNIRGWGLGFRASVMPRVKNASCRLQQSATHGRLLEFEVGRVWAFRVWVLGFGV